MSSTIYDIAKAANVSIATVSRVFNKRGNVSLPTKKRILDLADEMGYHPKAFAQGLARRNSKSLTILVPVLSNYFFMEVLAGVQDRIQDHDYDLNIHNISVSHSDDLITQVQNTIRKGMADGYVLISVHFTQTQWKSFKSMESPLVLVDEYSSEFDSVSVDSVEGAYSATEYLIQQGYQQVAMITASPAAKPSIDRMTGYRRALEDAGRMVNENHMITACDEYRDGFTEQAGYDAMKKLLNCYPEVDACFCSSDIQALGALKAMTDAHKKIALVGFDDLPISNYIGLTTMKQPMYQMGLLAVDKLMDRLKNPQKMVSHTVYSPELIVRESSTIKSQLQL